jgi:hypothetical protein
MSLQEMQQLDFDPTEQDATPWFSFWSHQCW